MQEKLGLMTASWAVLEGDSQHPCGPLGPFLLTMWGLSQTLNPTNFRSSSPKAATFPLSSGEAFELQDVKSHEIWLSRVSKSPGSEGSLRSLSSLSLPPWCDWHWLRVAVLYYFLSDYFKMVQLPLNFLRFLFWVSVFILWDDLAKNSYFTSLFPFRKNVSHKNHQTGDWANSLAS